MMSRDPICVGFDLLIFFAEIASEVLVPLLFSV